MKHNPCNMFAYRGVIVSSNYASNLFREGGFFPYKRLYSYKEHKTFLYVYLINQNPIKRVDELDLDCVFTDYSSFTKSFIFFLPKKIKACKLPVF